MLQTNIVIKAGYCDHSTPSIHIKGKWLNQAGFSIDTPLTVRIMHGCLVITTEEQAISQQRQLLKQIQQTEQRISEVARGLYQEKTQ